MYTVPTDVYTTYPQLARPLTRVSRDLGRTLRGACNSSITNDEILNYLHKFYDGKLGLFSLYEKVEEFHANIIFHENLLYLLNGTEEVIIYSYVNIRPIFEVLSPYVDENTSRDDLSGFIASDINYGNLVLVDIATAHKIFSQRESCLIYEDYAKIATKEYLQMIQKKLSVAMFGLYLLSNALILNVDWDIKDLNDTFENKIGESISSYTERIQPVINDMMIDISNIINSGKY